MGSISVFIAVSSLNLDLEAQVSSHLASYEMQGLIQLASRTRIIPGLNISRELESQIGRSDVALLLLSKDFLCDIELLNIQLPLLLAREAVGSVRIIPILMSPCLWEANRDLRQRQIFPLSGRSLSSLAPELRDEAIIDIVKALVPVEHRERGRELLRETAIFQDFLTEARSLRNSLSMSQQLLDVPKSLAHSMVSIFRHREIKETGRQMAKMVLSSFGPDAEKKNAGQVRKFVEHIVNSLKEISLYNREKSQHISTEEMSIIFYENLEQNDIFDQIDGIVSTLQRLQECEVWQDQRFGRGI